MFRGQNRQLTFSPADGMSVVGLGRIGVYEPRGTYQIILEYLEPAGIGALQIAFERLKQKLADAGLFDERRKRRLPFWPRKIGIVTSPTGAVVHDIITVTGRRCPAIPLEIASFWPAAADRSKTCRPSTPSVWPWRFSTPASPSFPPSAMKPTSRLPILSPTCGRRLLRPPPRSRCPTASNWCEGFQKKL